MREISDQMNCSLVEFNGEHYHIHLMINANPKFSISNLVGKLKGKSAYFIRKEFKSELITKLWGDHFWSPSYCVVSCGGALLAIVKQTIQNQRTPQY